MVFSYNPKKATQAVAFLVRLDGGQINLWRMLKLVYLFDRESLVRTGSPITGDALDNLPHGGVPSQIYDNTKPHRNPRFKDAVWQEYLTESIDNSVKLLSPNFETNELSQFDRDLIRETWEKFGQWPSAKLYDYVHELPEFRDPSGSSTHVDPEEILRHSGWTDDAISSADRDAKRELFLHKVSR